MNPYVHYLCVHEPRSHILTPDGVRWLQRRWFPKDIILPTLSFRWETGLRRYQFVAWPDLVAVFGLIPKWAWYEKHFGPLMG